MHLESKIYNQYPELFEKTLYGFSFDHGDGWYNIVEQMCRLIAEHLQVQKEESDFLFGQITEKFGTLRIYHNEADDYTKGLIDMAEALSSITCEQCGNPGYTRLGPWVRVLCDNHATQFGYKTPSDLIKPIA